MIGCAGYDFIVLDCEHSLVDPQELENLIRAAEVVGLTPLVRVPAADHAATLRALDAGAMGIVVPHVESRADVDAAIRAARCHPEVTRSLAGGRVPGFGLIDPAEYIVRANEEIMVIPLIEDSTACPSAPLPAPRNPTNGGSAKVSRPLCSGRNATWPRAHFAGIWTDSGTHIQILGFKATHLFPAVLSNPFRSPWRHPDPAQTPPVDDIPQCPSDLLLDHLGQRAGRRG